MEPDENPVSAIHVGERVKMVAGSFQSRTAHNLNTGGDEGSQRDEAHHCGVNHKCFDMIGHGREPGRGIDSTGLIHDIGRELTAPYIGLDRPHFATNKPAWFRVAS